MQTDHPTRASLAEARVWQSWQDYQDALAGALARLSAPQLQRRLLPGHRSPGELAQHIVFGRALHLTRALGAAAAELEPFLGWDDPGQPPRTAQEIVHGLELTWRIITGCLMRGSPLDPDPPPTLQAIWGLLDHDLPHAGQLSLLLRAEGLPGVEI